MSTPQDATAWLLLTFGDDRQYAGNRGYDDDVEAVYRYDSFVPNHKRIEAGNIAVLRDQTSLLGLARIAEVQRTQGSKTRLRCPQCSKTTLKERKGIRPRFRCSACKIEGKGARRAGA